MKTPRRVTESQVNQRIKVACAVAIVFTIVPLFVHLIPAQNPESFMAGVKEGINDSSMCRSLFSATLIAVVYIFRPSRLTFLATALLLTIAVVQFGFYIRPFPDVFLAVKNLLPTMAYTLTLSILSWLEYIFIYRAINNRVNG